VVQVIPEATSKPPEFSTGSGNSQTSRVGRTSQFFLPYQGHTFSRIASLLQFGTAARRAIPVHRSLGVKVIAKRNGLRRAWLQQAVSKAQHGAGWTEHVAALRRPVYLEVSRK